MTYPKTAPLVLAVLVAACSSTSGRSDAEPAIVFSGDATPHCPYERVQEIAVSATMRAGGREAAEQALNQALARSAARRDADAVMEIEIEVPAPVRIVARADRPPTQADAPAVTWRARGQAIRFTEPMCRR